MRVEHHESKRVETNAWARDLLAVGAYVLILLSAGFVLLLGACAASR